ncbi:ParB N-terminal domain-containing protein [Leucobacter komagatae]|uniref:Chromosome partitioning protein ParB n=1 Tax=Leucobacter komagatae TaxID=55969 RepID=A0A0D0H7C2_9MICO|nr:ParB N-terminal domain-containing protein [Leucobacter komagatae]KIP53060.1 chromosome partitioning protein ParB [Leucobacter komagatae]
MGERNGLIELERTVESITVGVRHRTEYGDLAQLIASIERDGLLQPITITPDGVLVCGARRLEAITQLGWRTVNVWVRSGITDRLGALLAEQDDNLLHKPLTPTEQATLYRELKDIMAEDAAQRQAATQFGPGGKHGGESGDANLASPYTGEAGASRAQAARMVTGRASYTTLERIAHLQTLAEDPEQTEEVRQRAREELAAIETGSPVYPAFQRINAQTSIAELERIANDADVDEVARHHASVAAESIRQTPADMKTAELERLATEALRRVKDQAKMKKPRPLRPAPEQDDQPVPQFPVRAFRVLWSEMANWWLHYDAADIAHALTDDEHDAFQETITGTTSFARQVAEHRATANTAQDVQAKVIA